MSARRTERLISIVILLLSTRQYLSAERIRASIEGYDKEQSDEAFKRSFERDKAELRDLGVPLETGKNSYFDDEEGYRISAADYELPAIGFEPDEVATIGLAARAWQSATLGAAAQSALVKLRAAGVDVDLTGSDAFGGPYLDAADPNVDPLFEASRERKVVSFDYTKAGATAAERRTLEPWGVLSHRRRWYVTGRDRARGEQRSFRLDRIAGKVKSLGQPGAYEIPEGIDLRASIAGVPERAYTARVAVTGTGAGRLRRMASGETDGVLTVPYQDLNRLARLIASTGAAVRALEPPELVEAVKTRLAGVAS